MVHNGTFKLNSITNKYFLLKDRQDNKKKKKTWTQGWNEISIRGGSRGEKTREAKFSLVLLKEEVRDTNVSNW